MHNLKNATFFDFRFSKRNKKKIIIGKRAVIVKRAAIEVSHFWFKYRLFTDRLSEIILDFQVWKTGFS
jgi:hypothetical protein